MHHRGRKPNARVKATKLPHTLLPQRNQIKTERLGYLQKKLESQSWDLPVPKKPAGWLKVKQGCVPFTWWARQGSGGCWHICEIHQSNLFSQHQLAQTAFSPTSSGFPESLPSPRAGNTLALLLHPPFPWQERRRKKPAEI